MLLLLFRIQDEHYAIAGARVVEVVPYLAMRNLPLSPDFVPGAINYRGHDVPVIDLCMMQQGAPCPEVVSTRIILVRAEDAGEEKRLVGLMAEGVTETVETPEEWQPRFTDGSHHAPVLADTSFLPHKTSLRWFDPSLMLPQAVIRDIFRELL